MSYGVSTSSCKAVLLTLTLAIASGSLACRKSTIRAGDRTAQTCADLANAGRDDLDLGGGQAVVRGTPVATLRGIQGRVIVTSLEGGAEFQRDFAKVLARRDGVEPIAVCYLVGLGSLDRPELTNLFRALSSSVGLVVIVPGPADDQDTVRAAVEGLRNVVEANKIPALEVDGLEILAMPGGDDPAALPSHDRGCLARPEDGKALAERVGKERPDHPRVLLGWSSPSFGTAPRSAVDALDVRARLISGPSDADASLPVELRPGDPSWSMALARVASVRSTSFPSTIPSGFITLRGRGDMLAISRIGRSGEPEK